MRTLFLIFFLLSFVTHAQFRPFVINECMPNNTATAADQDGEYNDWVEFYNNSTSPINPGGYFLSDRRSEPTKFKFPSLTLNQNEYLIVWLDKDTLQEGLHTNFKLSASSEQLYLFNSDTNLVDYVHFTNSQPDVSIARNYDGNGAFSFADPTFGVSNGLQQNGLVLNEWMANNTTTESDEYGEFNDWIELYNNSNESINLVGYFLSNKANEPTKYTFPDIVLNPNSYLVLWADEDSLQGALHLPFKLDSERDDILLSMPDTTSIDYFFHHDLDSNITMSRIPNGIGDLSIANATFESTNLPYVTVLESKSLHFNIYPNPTADFIQIDQISNTTKHIDLLDVNGRIINRFTSKGSSLVIDLSDLESGTYFMGSDQAGFRSIIKTTPDE